MFTNVPWHTQSGVPLFENRGLAFEKGFERSTPYVYEVLVDAKQLLNLDWNATAEAARDGPDPGGPFAMSADSHVGHLRLDYQQRCDSTTENGNLEPWIFIQVSRQNWVGDVQFDPDRQEVYKYNTQRQDYPLGPDRAPNFRMFFVSRFSEPFLQNGVTSGKNIFEDESTRRGNFTSAYVKFHRNTTRVEVRTGVSYVSIEQARKNLNLEIPDSDSFENTVQKVKQAWLEKLGRVTIDGVNETDSDHDPRQIWYTGLFHALQYPNDFSEPMSTEKDADGYSTQDIPIVYTLSMILTISPGQFGIPTEQSILY
ncbi:uncharacterized protein N7477_005233 [Penicillium maclennaniae]|uniref:uncharacterized protein n=1 Tax=Penicillium maclennaniae TaxID=1343394 RepID=UPI00254249AD|nr:uncharacterized protein N7477_005233 [Penicillium maclennaniae]KAJ5675299.1 hypothetical protein N7477_005233 [Penicillium maclennaniae]